MSIAQRFFLGLMILVLFSMLMYQMPEDVGQVRMGAWAILLQIGFYGLIVSRSNK